MEMTRETLTEALAYALHESRWRSAQGDRTAAYMSQEDTIEAMTRFIEGARIPEFDSTLWDKFVAVSEEIGYEATGRHPMFPFSGHNFDPLHHDWFKERFHVTFTPEGLFWQGYCTRFRINVKAPKTTKSENTEIFIEFLGMMRQARKQELEAQADRLAKTNEARAARGIDPFPSFEAMEFPHVYARKQQEAVA